MRKLTPRELNQQRIEKMRADCLSSLPAFTRLLYEDIDPYLIEWQEFVTLNDRTLLLGPRGHRKSISTTVAYSLWRLVHNPNDRQAIISKTVPQAADFISEIAGHCDRPLIQALFPHLARGGKWTTEGTRPAITVIGKTALTSEPSVAGYGIGSSTSGAHVECMLVDDLVDEENSSTKLQRDKLRNRFFNKMYPILMPNGVLHFKGTRWHPHDFYGHLLGTPEQPGTYADRAIIAPALDADGNPLWPEMYSLERLEMMRAEMGKGPFELQMLMNAEGYEGSVFSRAFLDYYDVPKIKHVVMGVDVASRLQDQNDYFAMVTVGLGEDGFMYPLNAYKARLRFAGQVKTVQGRFHACPWVCKRVGIESTAYQEVLAQALEDDTDWEVPVLGIDPSVEFKKKDKVQRAHSISAKFESGLLRLTRGEGMDTLREELIEFPDGEHDDLVDALVYAVHLLKKPAEAFSQSSGWGIT